MCHLLPLRGVIQLPRGALRMKMETNLGAHLPLANWHPCHSNTGDGKNEMPLIYEICHTYMRHQPTYEFTIGTVVRHRYLYTFAHFLPHRYCFYTYILPIRDGWCYDCGGRVHSLLPSEIYYCIRMPTWGCHISTYTIRVPRSYMTETKNASAQIAGARRRYICTY